MRKGLHNHTLILIAGLVIVAGCSNPSDGIPIPLAHGFVDDQLELLFEATNSDTVIVSTRVRPLIKGRGRILLYGWGNETSDTVFVLSPLIDTLNIHDSSSTKRYSTHRIEFEPNGVTEVRWKVRLQSHVRPRFNFSGTAFIDSIYIPDSSRYVPASGPVVREFLGVGQMGGLHLLARSKTFSYP